MIASLYHTSPHSITHARPHSITHAGPLYTHRTLSHIRAVHEQLYASVIMTALRHCQTKETPCTALWHILHLKPHLQLTCPRWAATRSHSSLTREGWFEGFGICFHDLELWVRIVEGNSRISRPSARNCPLIHPPTAQPKPSQGRTALASIQPPPNRQRTTVTSPQHHNRSPTVPAPNRPPTASPGRHSRCPTRRATHPFDHPLTTA